MRTLGPHLAGPGCALQAWGSMTNRCRDLARQGLTYVPPERQDLQAMLCRWLVAFA